MMHLTQQRHGAVSLRATLPRAKFLTATDVIAGSCSADWQACRAGDVFFALTTADDDGHEQAAAAVARGASAVVGERLVPVPVPQVLVRDSRSAFARTCQALAGHPSQDLRTIGVAGSAGKTVIAMLVAAVCEAAGEAVGVMSSLGRSDSVTQRLSAEGTPTAADLALYLGRMRAAGCDSAVLELSSTALAERRASGIALDAAILSNVHGGLAGDHNTPRAYQQALQRIFKLLKRGGLAIVNADDHRCRNLLAASKAPCLTYALHSEADVTAQVLERFVSEQTFLLTAGEETMPVRSRMIGDQHVANCLAATCFGLAAGFDLATIVRGLETVERVPGRMERLECGQPFGVFVDGASSPESLARAAKTLRQVTSGRVIVVLGSRASGEAANRAMLGRVLEQGAHVSIVTNDEPRDAAPLANLHEMLDGFHRPAKAHVIPNREQAIRFALQQARPGDCVLIAGRGDRVTASPRSQRKAYDDRELACELLFAATESALARRRFRVVG